MSRRSARIIGAPNVRLGTKCPSITSTWIHSAPPAIDLLELLAQPAEVGAQDARRDPRAHRPPAGGPLTTRSIREPRGRPLPGAGRVAMTMPGSGASAAHRVDSSHPDPGRRRPPSRA